MLSGVGSWYTIERIESRRFAQVRRSPQRLGAGLVEPISGEVEDFQVGEVGRISQCLRALREKA
jgi:hypothetical protein